MRRPSPFLVYRPYMPTQPCTAMRKPAHAHADHLSQFPFTHYLVVNVFASCDFILSDLFALLGIDTGTTHHSTVRCSTVQCPFCLFFCEFCVNSRPLFFSCLYSDCPSSFFLFFPFLLSSPLPCAPRSLTPRRSHLDVRTCLFLSLLLLPKRNRTASHTPHSTPLRESTSRVKSGQVSPSWVGPSRPT